MVSKFAWSALALTFAAVPTTVHASVIVTTYDFSANTPGFGDGTYSGSVDIAFDDLSMVYSLAGIDFSLGSTVFDLSNTGFDTPLVLTPDPTLAFEIFGTVNGSSITQMTDDFYLLFVPSDLSLGGNFAVAQAGVPSIGSPQSGTDIVVTRIDNAVPEPSTWMMLLLGFAATGFALRRSSAQAKGHLNPVRPQIRV
jgi:hypothetical protein